ncbi:MAG: hypothetical protein U0835_23590 [Isosphaeraceae bacterium]
MTHLSRVYQGPTTDDLGREYRDARSGAHMNARGNLIHGTRWAQVLINTPALFTTRME